MTKPYFKLSAIGVIILSFFNVNAQEIRNLSFSVQGNSVEITYDLIAEASVLFRIEVFSSHNNFSNSLRRVTGDVGENVAPGNSKRIVWDAKAELGSYTGDLDIEVRGFIMPPILQFTNIATGSSFKRGKTNIIQWESSTSEQNIRLELHRLGVKISDLGNVPNNGNYSWSIPKNRKLGKNFQVVAFSSQSQASSAIFKISPKIPIVLKVLPLLVVGGVVAVIVSGGGGDDPVGDPPEERLSDPIKPGG